MPIFIWKGKNSYGDKRSGKYEANDAAAVHTYLKKIRVTPSSVKEQPKDILAGIPFFQPKVTGRDVVIFTRQLSTMIDAGLPLVQSLEILGNQQENVTFKKVMRDIKNDVETGTTFADAMKKHPHAFDNLYCNMVEAGEIGGILDTILSRLADFNEKAMILKKKVKGAFTYPVICLCIAFVILGVILIFVVPAFEKMFEDFGSALPVPTQIVVAMSKAVQEYFVYGVGVMMLLSFLFKQYRKTDKGEYNLDALAMKLPVFGDLLKKVSIAKFSRTLSTMLQSGVPILEALTVVARTAGNRVIEQAIFRVADSISEGRSIAEPLEETGIFPNMVVQMISVGESTGALDAMLSKIADFYDEEVDQAVENLTAMIEPFMMVFLGGMVGGIVVAMYLPIFKMGEVVG
jgi:type IV pilus assembly protein PilC